MFVIVYIQHELTYESFGDCIEIIQKTVSLIDQKRID